MKKSLQNTFFRSLVVLFTIALIGTIILNGTLTYINFISQKEKIKKEIIDSKKEIMKHQVEFMISGIKSSREELEQSIKQDLKSTVETAYNIAQNLYRTQTHNPNIQEIIIESLRKLKFFDIDDQYVFMTKLDGTFLLLDGLRHLEGQNVFTLTTKSNKKTIQSIIDQIKEKKSGYFEYLWQDHHSLKFKKKLSYIKYFEPFDCYIGIGIFFKDIEKKLKENFIKKINNYTFGPTGQNYMFAATYEGYSFTPPAKGENVYDVEDKNGLKVVQEFIKLAKNGGGFLTYMLPLGEQLNYEKISYVQGIDNWNLYIGLGETLKDIDSVIEFKKEELINDLATDIFLIIIFGILFFILFYIFFNRIKSTLTQDIENMTISLEKLVTTNEKIDNKNIQFEEFHQLTNFTNELFCKKSVLENQLKEKEVLFYQQSKLAAMGEMIENIAHQWRQPLSMITLSSSSTQLKHEEGLLDDEYLMESLNNILESAEYLSNTIEDFRTFFLKNKSKESFLVGDSIQKALKLLKNRIEKQYIQTIKNFVIVNITSYKNELLQVYLVALNNAIDALSTIDGQKYIFIDIYFEEHNVCIEFKDNAGGIKEKYIQKIFDPYFTTKHKSQGTGIGLYMAKEIVEKHLEGTISIQNVTYTYMNKEYQGTKVKIALPAN
jgi:two-component system, NtrC family, sensor kinase